MAEDMNVFSQLQTTKKDDMDAPAAKRQKLRSYDLVPAQH